MRDLKQRGQRERGDTTDSMKVATFGAVRHLIGRLSYHVKAPKRLIEDYVHVENLFERYFVRQVPVRECIPPPSTDGLTTPDSMLKRMLPADDPSFQRYSAALWDLDHKLGIQGRILGYYEELQPRVHAEIQVLEHFYKNNLFFAGGDRYIACSKPACYCCHLYIRNHPLNMVEPATHKNLYPNWGIPLLPDGIADPDYPHHQRMLNKMLETIRRETLDQILRCAVKPMGHPDSSTGITPSISVMSADRPYQKMTLGEQLGRLNLGKLPAILNLKYQH